MNIGKTNQQSVTMSNEKIDNIKKTYILFAGTMLSAATGAYVGLPMAASIADMYWFIAIPWMLFGMFGLALIEKIKGVNLVGLYRFTFIGGIIMTPLLSHILMLPNGGSIVINSFLMTSVLFGSLGMFRMSTKSDFRSYAKPLVLRFFILIIFSIINLVFFESTIFHLFLQGIIFFVIAVLTIVDTQKIAMGEYTPIEGAIHLFLDFFNMFMIILQFMGIMGSDD